MKKLLQVQVTAIWVTLDDDGELGDTTRPVQYTVSGAEWPTWDWKEAFAESLKQLEE